MGSFINTDSILIDLSNSLRNKRTKKCQHFSLRGYVSKKRKAGWMKCWPSFPKLEEQRFKLWSCENCYQATIAEETNKKNERTSFDCSNTRHQHDAITTSDFETGVENNVNHQVSIIPSSEVCPNPAQKVHTKKRGGRSHKVSVVKPLARNLKNKHPMRNLRQKSTTTCSDIVPIENNSNIVKEDILDHQPSKSTTLPHEKHQKKRSISNLLRKNQDSGTKKTTKVHESTLSNLRSNASTDSHRRKKSKKNVDTCFQRTENEVENSEGDNETISTFLGNRLKKSCNKNGIRQTKKKVSFSLPLQEGTSKHKPIKKDSETKISRASRPNANGTRGKGKGKGKGVHIEKINGAKNKDETAEVMAEVGGKRTKKNSEKDTIDEIPMDVVEFMSKLQYERSLPDMGNTTGMVDEPIKESGNSIRENIVSCENGKSINLKKRNKQVKKRDTNINNPKSNGPRTLRNKNVEGLMDKSKQSTTPSNAAIGAEMLQTVFNSHHGNSKLKISSKKSGQTLTKSRKGRSSKSTMQNEAGASNNICESVCTINRNPADITVIEETNAYMINGEDIIFEDNVPEE